MLWNLRSLSNNSEAKGKTWITINNEIISFKPNIPKVWKRLSFKINVKERYFLIVITQNKFFIKLESGDEILVKIYERKYRISEGKPLEINTTNRMR